MPKLRGTARTDEKPCEEIVAANAAAVETCPPRPAGRSTRSRAWTPAGPASAARTGNTGCTSRGYQECAVRRTRGSPDGRPACMTRASSARQLRAARHCGYQSQSSQHRPSRSRTGIFVASPRTSVMLLSSCCARSLSSPTSQHRAGEIDADDVARRLPACTAAMARSAVPGAEIEDARVRRRAAASRDRPRAPASSRGRRSGSGSGNRSGRRSHRTSTRCVRGICQARQSIALPTPWMQSLFPLRVERLVEPQRLKILPAMKSARSSSVFGIW